MRYFFDVLTILGFLLTLLGTYLTYKSGESAEVLEKPIVSTCLIGLLLFASLWYHSFHRSAIYKSVFKGEGYINEALNQIIYLNHIPKRKSHVAKGISELSEICQQVSAGFRKYHKPDISICIHYVNSDENGPYVYPLCRNTESKSRPTKRVSTSLKHDYITENTDFSSIMNSFKKVPDEKIYYINNFLPFSPYYKNSHFSSSMRVKYYKRFGWFYRIRFWELPYKSTLVVPIITSESSVEKKIEGFLSIDSPQCWSFSVYYDLPIIKRFAGAIAPLVSKYNRSNLLDKK